MLFCKESWYGSGLLNIFHLNKKVTKPPLHPLPLNNPVLHLSLFAGYWWWIFSTSTAANCQAYCYNCLHCPPCLYIAHCPKKHCLPLSSSALCLGLCFAHTPRSLSPFPLWGFSDRQWAPRVTQLSNTTYMTVLVLSTTSFDTTNSVNYPTQLPRYKGVECTSIYMVDRGHTMDRRHARKTHATEPLDWPPFQNLS